MNDLETEITFKRGKAIFVRTLSDYEFKKKGTAEEIFKDANRLLNLTLRQITKEN